MNTKKDIEDMKDMENKLSSQRLIKKTASHKDVAKALDHVMTKYAKAIKNLADR